jgi:hypothetical protein
MANVNCGSCGKHITGEIVWCNPLRSQVPDDASGQSGHFMAVANSHQQSAGDAPYHPTCFDEMFGQKLEEPK